MTTHIRLLFANLPVDCEDSYLKAWIEAHGYEVTALRVIRDDVSFTSPNFAQVELTNPLSIDDAAEALNGHKLLGRTIQVRPAAGIKSAVRDNSLRNRQ